MERMLINATQEELRVAITKDNYLYDLDVEYAHETTKKANIYKGTITRIEPSLDAVFVQYGAKRQGFLPIKEIDSNYFRIPVEENQALPNLKELLKEGQEVMVQIEKEERGNKGAALTTYITLAGCYLVLMPNNPRAGGISRRIEGEEREALRNTLAQLDLPDGMGLIVRTAGLGKAADELKWDLSALLNQWHVISEAHRKQLAPSLLHQDGNIIIRSIRDNLRQSITEVIIDNPEAYVKAKNYIEQVKPDFVSHIQLYQDNVPLFNRYQVESQIETAYQRAVGLPSGGSVVIDRTEALVSIDVNSAKSTAGRDIESTALNTNVEAAVEVARQLRIRDLGGLIVIDFIDMSSSDHQRQVENALQDALVDDRARLQLGRISRFGLLEMSRQRLRLPLSEAIQEVCPRCEGRGSIRSIPSMALSIVRLIEEEALGKDKQEVHVQLPVAIATFILNEKRSAILAIEKRHNASILILPNPYFQAPQHSIKSIAKDDSGEGGKEGGNSPSYKLVEQPDLKLTKAPKSDLRVASPSSSLHNLPERPTASSVGILKRLWARLFSRSTKKASQETKPARRKPAQRQQRRQTGYKSNASRTRHPQQNRRRSGGGQTRRPRTGGSTRHSNTRTPRTTTSHNKKNSAE